MRTTARTTAVSALAAAALLVGAGTAAADEEQPVTPVDLDTPAGCVFIESFTGVVRCMTLDPAELDPAELDAASRSFGYGSFGTGSLADLLTGIINSGSVVLSVDVPNSTGSYAPGSTGSYGPEAVVGQVLTLPLASLGGLS